MDDTNHSGDQQNASQNADGGSGNTDGKDTQSGQQSDAQSDNTGSNAGDAEQLTPFQKQLLGRVKKLEEKHKGETNPPAASTQNQQASSTPNTDYKSILALKAKGFSDQEVLDLIGKAEKFRVSPEALLQDEDFMAGIEAKRAKAKVDKATPAPTPRTGPTSNGKTITQTPRDQRAQNFGFEAWRNKGRRG